MSKLKFQLVILIAMLFVSVPFCLAASQTREVIGYGATRDAAIQNGIDQAVEMVCGVIITSTGETKTETEQKYDGNTTKTKIIDTGKTKITKGSRGYVESYSILDEKRDNDGWKVRLSVKVFCGDRDKNKITIAISEIKPIKGRNRKLEEAFIERLHHDINQLLMKSSDFSVLNRRSDTAEFQKKELSLSGSAIADPYELRNIGRVQVANYLLFMAIQSFNIEYYRGEKNIITRKRPRLEDVKVHIIWEVVNAATGRICASGNSKSALSGVPVTDRRDTAVVIRAAQNVALDVQKQLSRQLKKF